MKWDKETWQTIVWSVCCLGGVIMAVGTVLAEGASIDRLFMAVFGGAVAGTVPAGIIHLLFFYDWTEESSRRNRTVSDPWSGARGPSDMDGFDDG